MRIVLLESFLTEATQHYVKKLVDPALMTWKEFYHSINDEDKHHEPSRLYQSNYAEAKKQSYKQKKLFETFINRIKINGRYFEIRKHSEKRDFIVRDEKGDYIRDESGNLIHYTSDQLKAMQVDEYTYTIGIFDDQDVCVATGQDEYNTILITTVEEYRGWGLGEIALREYRALYPSKDSGGFTPAGYALTQKYYYNAVRDYLAKGFYSFLVKQGHITMEKVKTITAQLKNIPPSTVGKKKDNLDYNFNNPNDFLVMDYDNGEFIIYNKKLIPLLLKDRDMTDHFALQGILGHVRLLYMGHKNVYRVQLFYATTPAIGKMLNNLIASFLYDSKEKVITDDQNKMFQHIDSKLYTIKDTIATSITHSLDYKTMAKKEKTERLKLCNNDRNDAEEIEELILEMAYYLSED